MPEPGSLGEAIESTAATFGDIDVEAAQEGSEYSTRGVVFASVGPVSASFLLPADVARGALGTPDTAPSPLGAGWIRFTPPTLDRFAVDRVQAWFVLAHRMAGQRPRGPRRPD
jgi:hypothetical protein